MFRWLIGSSLEFRVVILGIAAALVVFGSIQLKNMPVDVFPEYEPPVVKIQTEAIGLSAQEMEDMITHNLEEMLSGVPWLKSLRSESVTGLSSIELTFERGTDLIRARQMVQERLALAVYLPNVAEHPQLLQPLSSTSRFMMVGVSSKKIEPTELSLLARWTMKPKLVGIPGVANVAIWGQRLRQLHVQVDPNRLSSSKLTQDDVIAAAGDALWVSPLSFLKGSAPGTGGWIDGPEQRLGVHHFMPISQPEDMAKVAVTAPHLLRDGKQVQLGDVTEVSFGHPPMIGDASINGENGLVLVIEKFPSANTLEVTKNVEQALKELGRGLPDVKIDASLFRLASYIEDSFVNLTNALIVGAILVVLVIGAFLYNWRTALIGLISIPVSLLAAVIVLGWMGATLNTMILAGLIVALGVIIDDAIVGADALMRRLRDRQADDDQSIASIIVETTLIARGTALYGVLIVVLAVVPILFMGGFSGAFLQPLAVAYALAVLASLLVGLTVTPALSFTLMGKAKGEFPESPVARALRGGYEALLRRIVGSPAIASVGACVAIVIGIGIWPMLGQSLLPDLKEKAVVVNLSTAPGTSHAETYRIVNAMGKELSGVDGVRSVASHVGRAITGDQIVGINSAQIWLGVKQGAKHDELVAKVRETINGYPGIDRSVQSYLRDTVSEALTGASHPIVVRVFGHNREILRKKAGEVRDAIAGVEGLVDVRAVGQVYEPQIKVRVDLEKAAKESVKPGEVRRSAATVFAGLTVGYLYEQQKIFDVLVWSPPEARRSIDDIRNHPVERSDRTRVRLGDVADVRIEPVPTVLKHDGLNAYVDVVANVSGRDIASVTKAVEDKLESVTFPLEFYPVILGEYEEQDDVTDRALGLGIAALLGIFLLLQACLGSWRVASIVFLAIPASAAGGIVALLITGNDMTLGAIAGFFAVLGIASRNGMMLVGHYQNMEANENVSFGADLVLQGAGDRMSAILGSSLAIIAALLPIVALGSLPGLEIVQPTAIVIIGGVIASTLMTLLIIPALYLKWAASGERLPDLSVAQI
jgi:CzcA family heavy metal efflux pump